jgi:hypothetical protein
MRWNGADVIVIVIADAAATVICRDTSSRQST